MLLQIPFDIFAMLVIVWFFDKEEAADTFNLAITVLLNTAMTVAVALLLAPAVGPWAAVAAMLLGTLLLIRWRFTLTWGKTAAVLVLFYAAKIAFALVLGALMTTSVRTP
jgi:hypothetical protein